MKTKKICLVILASALMVSGVFAGTEIIEKQTVYRERSHAMPYGKHTGLPLIDDDDIKSPWSDYIVETPDEFGPGQILYDPVVGRPFMVPEDW